MISDAADGRGRAAFDERFKQKGESHFRLASDYVIDKGKTLQGCFVHDRSLWSAQDDFSFGVDLFHSSGEPQCQWIAATDGAEPENIKGRRPQPVNRKIDELSSVQP